MVVSQEDVRAEEAQRLTPEEMEAEAGAELPDPEVLSLVDASLTAPAGTTMGGNPLADGTDTTLNTTQPGDAEKGG